MELIDERAQKSVFKSSVSRCLYCNSTSYGKGCRFAPKGVHFHPSDPKKCSYCGAASYGRGCRLNPFGDIHLHGIDYNKMFNESLKNKFLTQQLNKDFTDFEAYKLGIINEKGNKIKEPITEQERAAYSSETKTILKIKKYLGSKLDLINQTAILENTAKIGYNKDTHKTFLEYEQKINDIFTQLHETTDNAIKDGLTLEQVQALLQ
jgi:hypothetical protein